MEETKNKNVFTNNNFRLVFFGALVSELGISLYCFAVGFYILDISGNNAFLQGLYLSLTAVSLLLLTPIGGVLGDRFSKARIMAYCDFIKGGLIVLGTALMLVFRSSTAQIVNLFIVGIAGNAVSGIFWPSSNGLLPHIVAEEKLQQANAYFSVKSALINILGAVSAGVLYNAISVYALFFIVGGCYVFSGVSEMFIRYAHKKPDGRLTVRTALYDMRDGFVYLKGQKPLMTLMAAILMINFFFAPLSGNFLPYFVKTDIAPSPSYLFDNFISPELWSGVISMVIGVSALIGAVILSVKKPKEKVGRSTAVQVCILAAVMIVLTVCYGVFVAYGDNLNAFLITLSVGGLVFGSVVSCINIPINTAIMRTVDKDKLSKVNSITSVLSQGMTPVASMLAGVVLQYWGSTPLLGICSAGFTAAALFMTFSKQTKKI
ncbi:MAG: MFS transporter [Clostridia bacterium]|nr:MFS transporter [Clostridia bacterium]